MEKIEWKGWGGKNETILAELAERKSEVACTVLRQKFAQSDYPATPPPTQTID